MKIQLLPSNIDSAGRATPEQHLTCFLIDDSVAVDAGSIAIALTADQRRQVRDIIVTHSHMDHIATLPIFVDDLYATLKEPIRIHATQQTIDALERDVFNWNVYPRFSRLRNDYGPVMEYLPIPIRQEFIVAHLRVTAIPVDHVVPTIGLIVSDEKAAVAFSSDTGETEEFWAVINRSPHLGALMIESSFPNSMAHLAKDACHLTPATLAKELRKLSYDGLEILVVHIKPAYREKVIEELHGLGITKLRVMEPGRTYTW
ncbi:MAG: 3',5'-cyclic-nucleotide phosphodiesterase [Acidobacteriota bacterium]|nr:3',5'-cyclic-nucleotide phosphodiesterase [Acidobacteriota bacterium]